MAARYLRETRQGRFDASRQSQSARLGRSDKKTGKLKAGPTTRAGRRLVAALQEVFDDIRGVSPLLGLADIPATVDAATIRRKTGLSQSQFAKKYGIKLRTLQDWEQGRYQPTTMGRALLTMIDRDPERTARALAAE